MQEADFLLLGRIRSYRVNDPDLNEILSTSKEFINNNPCLNLKEVPEAYLRSWIGDYNYTLGRLKYEPLKLTDRDIVSLSVFAYISAKHNSKIHLNDLYFTKYYVQFQTLITRYINDLKSNAPDKYGTSNICNLPDYQNALSLNR